MKKLNPDHMAAIAKTVNTSPFFELLSMEIKYLRLGESRIEVEVQKKHLQPYGMVHGGVCASLVDASVYWAVYAGFGRAVGLTTVDLRLNYLAPVQEGKMIAKGRSIKTGKTICLGEATIEDENGKLLSHGTSTLMVMESLKIKGHSELPPKFLE
ncbi:PaaI family thioesterase [Thermodesulfobacteriota bacterium]